MNADKKENSASISARSFLTAVLILLLLMVITFVLTLVIPSGAYQREIVNGQEIVIADTYRETDGGISVLKWLLSPILVLFNDGNVTIIAIILFLIAIGGTFNSLEKSGILKYMLSKISYKYKDKKYKMLCLVTLFFMTLGTCVGSFEECVPMVPIAIALAYSMGWDAFVGLGMSLLAVGCGFATGILNPFTVGVAQKLANLPMFSGMSFRIISFILIYAILVYFLVSYAKKVENKSLKLNNNSLESIAYEKDINKDKALLYFACILGLGMIFILLSTLLTFLQGVIMPVIALIFLLAGIVSVVSSGVNAKELLDSFKAGVIGILPAILLILMASSIKYTMVEAQIMDTILFKAINIIEVTPKELSILLIYLLILIMNFFISSGSAKAFLLMPLITPLVDLAGISRQVSILAFAYGDGFSNLFYPTNPVLLISLGLAGISYGKWVKWSLKIQCTILLVTSILLITANLVGY